MKVAKIKPVLDKVVKEKEEDYGPDQVCEVCILHDVFKEEYDKLITDQMLAITNNVFRGDDIAIPLCPKCDKPLEPGTSYGYICGVVGGSNIVNETENMQYCQLWYCADCDQDYALMPEAISWNANHDILYTGGAAYLTDDDEKLLLDDIKDGMLKSIEQFVRRVKNPECSIDKNLSANQLNTWLERNITGAVAKFLHEKGLKK